MKVQFTKKFFSGEIEEVEIVNISHITRFISLTGVESSCLTLRFISEYNVCKECKKNMK